MVPLLAFLAPVSFAASADVAARLLPRLGAAVGVRLSADAAMGRQTLLVRVTGMDRDRLLALVASASGGAWRSVPGGGLRLVLDGAGEARLWRDETKDRQAWIADPKTRWQGASGSDATTLRSLATLVGTADLAALRPGTRQVWSLPSQPGTRPLPEAVADLARSLVAARRKRFEEAERRGADMPDWGPTFAKAPATCTFAARRGLGSNDVGVAFQVAAADGAELAVARGRLSAPLPERDARLVARMPDVAIPFSEGTRGMAAVAAGRAKAGPAILPRFLHPETWEPLAFAVGPALGETARAIGTDVVAFLPDAAYGPEFADAIEGGIGKTWPRELARNGMMATLDGGVLVVRPTNRASALEARADRTLLRRRIADVERDGHLNFRYSLPYGLEYAVLSALPVDLYHDLYRWEWPWDVPLAWNELTFAQRARALGEGLPLTEAPDFVARLAQAWSTTSLLEPDETIVARSDLDAMLRLGVLRASVQERPIALVVRRGAVLPETFDALATLAERLAAPDGDPLLRDPATTYVPGVRTDVAIRIAFTGEAPAFTSVQPIFPLYERTGGATHYPDLFPALREAILRANGR